METVVLPKHWYLSAKFYGILSHMTIILHLLPRFKDDSLILKIASNNTNTDVWNLHCKIFWTDTTYKLLQVKWNEPQCVAWSYLCTNKCFSSIAKCMKTQQCTSTWFVWTRRSQWWSRRKASGAHARGSATCRPTNCWMRPASRQAADPWTGAELLRQLPNNSEKYVYAYISLHLNLQSKAQR
jgi:hypothetical protein